MKIIVLIKKFTVLSSWKIHYLSWLIYTRINPPLAEEFKYAEDRQTGRQLC